MNENQDQNLFPNHNMNFNYHKNDNYVHNRDSMHNLNGMPNPQQPPMPFNKDLMEEEELSEKEMNNEFDNYRNSDLHARPSQPMPVRQNANDFPFTNSAPLYPQVGTNNLLSNKTSPDNHKTFSGMGGPPLIPQ